MRDYKSFYLCYFDGNLCKKSLEDAKNYFYDFFQKNITEDRELTRIYELRKFITEPDDLQLIESKIASLKITCSRNEHIVRQIESEIEELSKQNIREYVYQAVWLKSILKYYPNQGEYIIKDYGSYVNDLAKALCSSSKKNIPFYVNELLNFADEYRKTIFFTIKSLGNLKCKLINGLKINHALQVGFETYLIGGIKNDGVAAALLSDALQYSTNPEKLQRRIEKITDGFNGKKVLDIYKKTGQDSGLLNESWDVRKQYQLKQLTTPGSSSFSATVILLIGKKINLYEISKLFEEFEISYKESYPEATSEMLEAYLKEKKEVFWNEYASITEEEAKEYYSILGNIFDKLQNIPDFLLKSYEENYFKVFNQYPN